MQLQKLTIRYLIGLSVAAAIAAIWTLVQSANTGIAWVAALPALLLLYVVGEWAFEPILTKGTGKEVSPEKFSGLRIVLALLLMLPIFVVMFLVGWATKEAL